MRAWWWGRLVLCFVCLLVASVHGQPAVPGLTNVIETIFSGSLDDVTISGDAVLESEDELSMKLLIKVRKEDDFGLDTTIRITDDKCDFQNIKATFTVDIVWSPAIRNTINQVCQFVSSLPFCSAGGKTRVIEEERTINLLEGDTLNPQVVSEFTLSASDTTVSSAKSVLDYVGGDFTLKIANPKLMVAGMNFSIFVTASAFKSSAPVCTNTLTKSICTSANEISLSNVNLGKEMSTYIANSNNGVPPTWIKGEGTIVVGRNSLSCIARPGSFRFDMSGKNLPNFNNPTSLREALAATASRCMPEGYDVSVSSFQNLTIIPDGAGGYQVAGLAYGGAAKDPAGVMQALRECLAKSADSLDINGKTAKISGLEDDRSGCTVVRNNNNMCSTGAPPSSAMEGGDTVELGGKQPKHRDVSTIATTVGVTVAICMILFIAYRKYEAKQRAVGDSLNGATSRRPMFTNIFGGGNGRVQLQDSPPKTIAGLNGEGAGNITVPASSVSIVQSQPSWEELAIRKQNERNGHV